MGAAFSRLAVLYVGVGRALVKVGGLGAIRLVAEVEDMVVPRDIVAFGLAVRKPVGWAIFGLAVAVGVKDPTPYEAGDLSVDGPAVHWRRHGCGVPVQVEWTVLDG